MGKNIIKTIIIAILRLEVRIVLLKYRPFIIAVTGSVGKTSTKDAIFAVICDHFFTYKSKKSYNSEFGVPLTILMEETGWNNPILWIKNILKGLPLIFLKNHYPKWLVIEVGIDRPGGMKKAVRLIKPNIAVFTKFPDVPVHVEFFKKPGQVHDEKWLLAENILSGGFLIINNDDKALKERAESFKGEVQIITYGTRDGAMIKAENIHTVYKDKRPVGTTFKVEHNGNNVPIKIRGVLGIGCVYSALAAIAVGISQGLNLVQISEAISLFEPPPGRLRVFLGVGRSVIIDDTYNSSPDAVKIALDVLKSTEGGRKIAVLGDMLELGSFSTPAHKEIGEYVRKSGIDILYTVGPRAKQIADGANSAGMKKTNIKEFYDVAKTATHIAKNIEEGDIVLIKGSQGIRMEKIVSGLLLYPEKSKGLLVRQEKEWQNR